MSNDKKPTQKPTPPVKPTGPTPQYVKDSWPKGIKRPQEK